MTRATCTPAELRNAGTMAHRIVLSMLAQAERLASADSIRIAHEAEREAEVNRELMDQLAWGMMYGTNEYAPQAHRTGDAGGATHDARPVPAGAQDAPTTGPAGASTTEGTATAAVEGGGRQDGTDAHAGEGGMDAVGVPSPALDTPGAYAADGANARRRKQRKR